MAISPTGIMHSGMPAKPEDAKEASKGAEVSAGAAKRSLNASIIQSSMEASISAKNRPLSLLLQAAIESLNETLEPELGPDAIQKAADSGLDVSPEATAQRIVDLSTAFFGAYKEQHPNMSDEEALDGFLAIIGEGIDRGFSEAREILGGLNVLEGDIADNIDRTYELVQQGLETFRAGFEV